jgi:hypothetical protein
MGRKSSKKQMARNNRQIGRTADKRWWVLTITYIIIPSALLVWSFDLLEDTFIPNSVIIAAVLGGSVSAIFFLFYLWRKVPYPIWVLLFYGAMIGSSITMSVIVCGNYYFKSNSTVHEYLEILDTGENKHRRDYSCRTVYALVARNGAKCKVKFSCQFKETISNYRQVKLEIAKGLFGFYVFVDQELIK